MLPFFTSSIPINRLDIISQLNFLRKNKIGFTDLLISINDAEIENENHRKAINSFKDSDLAKFNDYTWNTPHIIEYLRENEVSNVYFSRIGDSDIFSKQIREIEKYCVMNEIYCNRLFTPSGQGLGSGKPRINKLINQWYFNNGASNFPFLSNSFNINEFKWA